jgi:hypothetical protein
MSLTLNMAQHKKSSSSSSSSSGSSGSGSRGQLLGPAVGDHKVQQSSSNRITVLVMAVHLEHSSVLCCDQGQQQQQQQQQQGQQAPEFPAASS